MISKALFGLSLGFAMMGCGLCVADSGDLRVGDSVPGFELLDREGKSHSLEDYRGKPVVLSFVATRCPWTRGAQSGMSQLSEEYGAKGVVFLGIYSDSRDTFVEIGEYAEELGVRYGLLRDDGNVYADAVTALRTPHIYIVDAVGKLAYRGAFDNRETADVEGTTNYVRPALDALLGEETVSVLVTSPWGCPIYRVTDAAQDSE